MLVTKNEDTFLQSQHFADAEKPLYTSISSQYTRFLTLNPIFKTDIYLYDFYTKGNLLHKSRLYATN